MYVIFLVYLATGCILGPYKKAFARQNLFSDWMTFFAWHIPAILLTILGVLAAKREGRFMGMDIPLFLIAAAGSYIAGVVLGFYIA